MFQLRAQLQNATISDVPLAGALTDNPGLLVAPDTVAGPVRGGRVKGKLSRSWTHNEQLFVRCCGIIIS
jgi:hypothetical protein